MGKWKPYGLDRIDLPEFDQIKLDISDKSRPKKTGPVRRFDRLLNFKMSNELYRQWNDYLDRHGLNGSEVLRDMIKRRLNSEAFMEEWHEVRKTRDI